MAYPKQLISSLSEQINEKLLNFFEIENRKYFQNYADLNDIVENTLWQYIKNETEKSELRSVYGVQVKQRRQKRLRWMESFKKNLEDYPSTDKKNPFYSIYRNYDELPGHSFLKLYDASEVETVIDNYKKALEGWIDNDKSLLIDYPLISTKTDNQVLTSFKTDLVINLIDIIMDSLDGNIESYFAKKPDILLENPLFAATKFSIPFKASLDSYVADLINSDSNDMVFQMLVNHEPEHMEETQNFRVFDPKDNQLLLTLINNIKLDFYDSKAVAIEVGALARSLNAKPNKRCYEDVKQRLHNMARTGFRLSKKDNPGNPIFTFNFLDNVLTQEQNGKEYAIVTFGNVLYEAITKKKMIAVTSNSYNSLDLELSKLLYHNLQKERILLSTSSVPDDNGFLYKSYDYSYFQRIILFKKKKKADNILLLKKALDEFVDKKIALAKFEYVQSQGLFHLYYFQLSEDETADLVNNNEIINFPTLSDSLSNSATD